MRVAFLVFNLHGMGGTSRSVITQANALAAEHDVHLVSVVRSAELPHYDIDPQITVDHLVRALPDEPPSATSGVVDAEAAAALAERESLLVPTRWDAQFSALTDVALEDFLPGLEADVLVTVTPGLLAAAIQLVTPGVAVVHQEHRSSSDRTSGLEALLSFAPRADAVVVLTESMAQWLGEQLGPVRPEIRVMPNPLPLSYAPRSRLDDGLIVAAGRIAKEKQFNKLISAFAQVADQLPDWRLRILGDGPQQLELKRVVRKLGLWDRVELPGPTPDMQGEWAKASFSALTSRSEGFPLVAQEAMAAGVPVASFDCAAGPRELIEHDVNGLLVSPDSVQAMAAALLRLATDPELRTRLGEAAFQSSRRYAATELAAQWEGIFGSAVDRSRAAAGGRLLRRTTELSAVAEPSPTPEQPTDVTPVAARAATLSWLVGIAEQVSDGWFVVPHHGSSDPVVVLPMPDRDAFLRELAAGDGPAYVSMVDSGGFGWPERRDTPARLAADLRRGRTPRFSLEPWPTPDGRPGLLGQGCRLDVEFWEVAADGTLLAPSTNPYTTEVPPGTPTVDTELDGVAVRTLALMQEPTVGECRFPIDLVYTWVDGGDPVWNDAREQRLAAVTGTATTRESSGRARFASRDELRYSMRSVHLFAPWVRRIHLVTAGQVPEWLDTGHPRIRIVDHRELLPGDALPTFNSHAIETGLHRVPDLTEQWVYVNDDVLLGRPLRPEKFFTPAGQSAVFLSQHSLGLSDIAEAQPWRKAGWNNRRLLQEAFGVTITDTLAHTPHPHRVSVLDEIERRFPEAIGRTARSPFRSDTDVSLLSSLAQHYGLITGSAVVGDAEGAAFIDLSAADLGIRFGTVLRRDQDFINIGDHHVHGLAPQALAERLTGFLDDYFPIAAPWEKP